MHECTICHAGFMSMDKARHHVQTEHGHLRPGWDGPPGTDGPPAERTAIGAALEEELQEYRRRVEDEVVDLLVTNLRATAEALDREMRHVEASTHRTAAVLIEKNREDWGVGQ